MAIFVPRFVRQLRDVLLTAPADGEVLTYDSADEKWKNAAGGGGGGDLTDAVILAPASSARNVIQPTAGAVTAAIVKAHAAQSVDLTQWQLSSGALAWGLSKGGHEILADLAAPADGDVPTGQRWQWYDDSVGAPVLKFTQRDSAGTLFKGRALSSDYDTGAVRIAVVDGVAAIDYVLQLEIPDRDIITGNGYGPYFEASGEQIWGIDAWGAMYLSGPFVGLEIAKQAGVSATKILSLAEGGLQFYGGDADTTTLFSTNTVIDGIGFFTVAPVVQQTAASVGDLWTALKNYGLLDVGSSAPDVATQAELDAHVNDASDAHDASAISFSPTGTIAATDVQAAIAEVASEAGGGGISPTLFDANTVLAADTDDTPAALTMGASTILARLAAGNIKAATPAELRTLLDVPTTGEAILDAIVDAKGDMLAATAADTVSRLAVGTNGHVLTADSVEATGIKWAAAAGGTSFPRKYKTGLYYQTNQAPAGDLTKVPVMDRVEYHPFPVGEALTIDRITCGVSTAGTATAVVRLGIYNDTDGMPDTLLLDAGTVAGDSSGYKEITVSQALSAGTLYWIAVVWQVASVGAGVLRASGIGAGAEWTGQALISSDARNCTYLQAGVTGALPSPATPTATSAVTQSPSVKVRAT